MAPLGEPAARMRHAIRNRGRVVAVVVILGEPAARMRHALEGSVVAAVVVLGEPAARMRHATRGCSRPCRG